MRKIKRILKKAGVIILTAAMLTGQTGFMALAEEIVEVEAVEDKTADNEVGIPEEPSLEKQIAEEAPEIEKEESETIDSQTISTALEKPYNHSDEGKSTENTGDKEAVKKSEADMHAVSSDKSESPKETVSSDNADLEKESVSEDSAERKRFEESGTLGGVTITVEAEEGVFPEDAVLSVKEAGRSQEKQAEEAVEEERPEDQNVAASYTYDIKVLDKEGNELQPADGADVKVSFTLDEVADSNLMTNIYHIREADPDGTASEENSGKTGSDPEEIGSVESDTESVGGDNKASENTVLVAEKLSVETDGDTATAETDGFSLYTVEFTYNDLQYVMPGDSDIPLSEILDAVGLAGDVSDIKVSDSSLFSAARLKVSDDGKKPARGGDGRPIADDNGVWFVTAHKAFNTNEWMTVTINGIDYKLNVTDDVEITTWEGLKTAFRNDGATVTLTQNISAGSGDTHLEVPNGVTVTLDLNGKTLDYSCSDDPGFFEIEGESEPFYSGAIVVMEGGKLILKDSGENGTINGIGTDGAQKPLVVYGNCEMQGGTVRGGLQAGDEAYHGNGSFVMTDGTISGSSNKGWINILKNMSFTMSGGELKNCPIRVVEGGGFTVNGGSISCTRADVDYVVDMSEATFNMTAGTITGTNMEKSVIRVSSGTNTLSGGTITGSGEYGGILLGNGILNIEGNPTIEGGICFAGLGFVTVTGELTNTQPIPVSTNQVISGSNPKQITSGLSNGGTDAKDKFSYSGDELELAVEVIDGSEELVLRKPEASHTDWEKLQIALQTYTAAGLYRRRR